MWAYTLNGPGRLDRVDTGVPDLAERPDTHVLLRTLAGGVCGSDVPRFLGRGSPTRGPVFGRAGYPMHEIVGEVVASRRADRPVGCRVVGWATDTNGLAEYVVTDGDQVAEYDPSFASDDAVTIQSIACVLYAVDQIRPAGQRVAILGLGPIGLLFAHVCKDRGAAHVVGVDPVDRRAVADPFGLDETVRSSSGAWSADLTTSDRYGITIEAVGHQTSTLDHALTATSIGGTVLHFGIPDVAEYPLNMEMLMRHNLTLIGGVTRSRHRMLVEAGDYLMKHREPLQPFITHRFPMVRAQHAYETAVTPSDARIKVVLSVDGR